MRQNEPNASAKPPAAAVCVRSVESPVGRLSGTRGQRGSTGAAADTYPAQSLSAFLSDSQTMGKTRSAAIPKTRLLATSTPRVKQFKLSDR